MTHDHVTERLPWLVNGSLADGERREVEAHLAACPDCRAELSFTRDAYELFSTHLPPRLLVAYAETPAGDRWTIDGATVDRRSVDAHLAHCDDCREELEMVRQARAALAEEAPGAAVVPFARPRQAAAAPRPWLPMALAASLLLALVSAGGWWFASQPAGGDAALQARVAELERELAAARGAAADDPEASAELRRLERELAAELDRRGELETTVAGLEERVAALAARGTGGGEPLAFLYAEGVLRTDGGAEAAPLASPGERLRLVVLVPSLAGSGPLSYRVTTADGTLLLRGTRAVEVRDDAVAGPLVDLSLPAAELPAGRDLVLRLDAGDDEVASAPFRLTAAR